MKTQPNIIFNSLVYILFITVLLLITSCKGEKGSEHSSGKSGVNEPPKIDIHTAVITGNMDILKQHILNGTNLNERDPFGGSSPLISASVFGKTEEARVLIEAGADINFQNNDGSTALHTAAFFCRPEIVKMLIEKGADKTIKNKYNATPYESVAGPFSEAKNSYDLMGTVLSPMGLKLDYPYIEKTRPEIAGMLK